MKIILILLYLYGGQVTLHQEATESQEACVGAGMAKAYELVDDPKFDELLYAKCLPLEDTSK